MKKISLLALVLLAVVFLANRFAKSTGDKEERIMEEEQLAAGQEEIYFAGGCFWGTEHFLKQVRGVKSTSVGYANGNTQNPTYEEVCTGRTGFAETVKVVYDPQVVELGLLIDLFFKTIDPTSLNKQGNDVGTQYRAGIYYTNTDNVALIQEKLAQLAPSYEAPLVVEVEPLKNYYAAEGYHQDYLDKNPGGYCHISPALFDVAKKANQ